LSNACADFRLDIGEQGFSPEMSRSPIGKPYLRLYGLL
jgi:hypothetical protein